MAPGVVSVIVTVRKLQSHAVHHPLLPSHPWRRRGGGRAEPQRCAPAALTRLTGSCPWLGPAAVCRPWSQAVFRPREGRWPRPLVLATSRGSSRDRRRHAVLRQSRVGLHCAARRRVRRTRPARRDRGRHGCLQRHRRFHQELHRRSSRSCNSRRSVRVRPRPRPRPRCLYSPPSLSPRSPLYSISVTELLEMLGPDFDFDLEIERNRYKK